MKKILLITFILTSFISVKAQNCTVNANVDRTICINQTMTLVGQRNGLFSGGTTWTQVAGPSVIITNPTALTTTITGYVVGQVYTFRLSGRCRDGIRAFDDVRYTVRGITIATAGVDQLACPGSSVLNGNAPGVNETGQWLSVTANDAGVTISNPIVRNTSFTTSAGSAGSTTLRWRIANTNGCSSFDDMVVTNYGGISPVVTNKLIRLDSCYSTTHCANLIGTYGGNGSGGQIGTWSQLSGPTTATISTSVNNNNVTACNLIQGRYRFRWTVSGPCVNGSDTVLVIVPRSTSSLTGASFGTQYFCSPVTIATLIGNSPTYSGETVQWTQVGGPGGVTIASPNSRTTLVSGLDGTSTYRFRYTINNAATLCTGFAEGDIIYITPPTISFRDTILPCQVEQFTIPINGSGGLNMYYRIASAPVSWGTTPTTYSDITGATSLTVNGLNIPGDYVIDVQRTSPLGASCTNASRSFKVTVSKLVVGANAGTDQFLACNIDSTRLAGNIPDPGFTGTWSRLTGPNDIIFDSVNLYNSFITGAPSGFQRGRYTNRWTISGGPRCPKASDDVFIYFAPTIPNPVLAGPNRTVCYGTTTMQGNDAIQGETGEWSVSPSAGITFSNINDPRAEAFGLAPNTTYNFKWKRCNTCGCDSSISIVTTNGSAGPPAPNAGADRCLPSGTTNVTLNATNPSPSSGRWTQVKGPAATITNDTLFNTTVTGLTDSNYVFEWRTIRGGCNPRRDSMNLTIRCISPNSNAGPDRDSCGSSITMAANTPPFGIGTWVQVSGNAGWSISNPNAPNARITSLLPGTYRFVWVITNGIAPPSRDTVQFNIDAVPSNPDAGIGQKICASNGVLTLTGNTVTNVASTNWSLLSPAPNTPNILTPSNQSTVVSGMIAGIYTFRYTANSIMGICPSKFDDVMDTIILNANAGRDTGFCDTGVYNLIGSPGSTGTWTKLSGGNATIITTGVNRAILANAGSFGSPYRFIYSIPATFGCPPTSDTITIVYSDTASSPLAGADQRLCNSPTVTMAANSITAPGYGLWTQLLGPNTATINTPSSNTTTIGNLTSGIYLFNWMAANGFCTLSDQVKVTIDPAPSASNAGPDRTLCPDTVKMNANILTVGTGLWSQFSGPNTAVFDNSSDPKTSISNLTQGIYRFVWQASSGVCTPNTDTVQVNVPNLKPTTALAGSDSLICNRTESRLNGNSPTTGTGTWSQLSGPSSTIASANSNNSNLTLSTPGIYTYQWNITNGICTSLDTFTVSMTAPATTANAGGDSTVCVYAGFTLYGNNPTVGTGTWRQLTGSSVVGFVDSNAFNTTLTGVTTGSYTFRWQIRSGICPTSQDNVTLNTLPAPATAIAGATQALCGPLTTLNGSQDSIGTPLWQTVSGPNSPTLATPNNRNTNVTNLTNGNYRFRYSITNATCVEQDTVLVIYLPPSVNDKCETAKILVNPNPIANDSLCGGLPQIGEPNTCGLAPCNSIFYRFQTNPSLWYKDITFNFTNIGSCINGLRASLFNDGTCPSLGVQHKTCQTINAPGSLTFTDLAPATVYYLILDENTPICTYSKCDYTFQVLGEPLPIELNSITANLASNTFSHINWKTSSEITTKEFIIERSTNGSNFTNIATVKSLNSAQMNQYKYIDNVAKLSAGKIYYRIKEVGFDGKVSQSQIVSVNKVSSFISNVSISPNPSSGVYNVAMNLEDDADIQVKIMNTLGQEIIYNANALTKGSNTIQVDLSNYAEGIYYIHLIGKDSLISEKVVLVK